VAAKQPKVADNGADEIKAAVQRLTGEMTDLASLRADAENTIARASAEQDALPLDADHDEKFDELDRDIKHAERRLRQCDMRQPLLAAQFAALRDRRRREQFDTMASQYLALVREYVDALTRVLELKNGIARIRAAAEAAGFPEGQSYFEMPFLRCSAPEPFAAGVAAALEHLRLQVGAPPLVNLRFKTRCGVYHAEECAGFDRETADAYVTAGVAEVVPQTAVLEGATA
jgi:hypothetical protein